MDEENQSKATTTNSADSIDELTRFVVSPNLKPNTNPINFTTASERVKSIIANENNASLVDEGGFSRASDDKRTVEPLLRRDTVHTNGFLDALLAAWKEHHTLALKPQHIHLAIVQQFAIHVNEHPEELRSSFVDFEGKKELRVKCDEFVRGQPNDTY